MTPLEFLTNLYANCQPGWISLFAVHRPTGQQVIRWHRTDRLDTLVEEATTGRLAEACVWFGVATRKDRLSKGRGTATDCLEIPALWLDLDVTDPTRHKTDKPLPPDREAARLLLSDHPIAPTIVVDSGGGLQAFWILDEPLAAHEAQPVLDRWHHTWTELARRRGWHIDNVHDVPRIMRLPGTHNTKGVAA